MKYLYTVAQIRAIERAACATLPQGALMQRAGQAAANVALALIAGLPKNRRSVLLLAGPGNNGGDALEAAANLAHTNAGVDVAILHVPGASAVTPETADALARARASQARFVDALPEREPGLVVDGLFGIGLTRPFDAATRALVEQLNARHWQVLALDVPSGLDADTGTVVGSDGAAGVAGVAVLAQMTLTFIADKPGLHTLTGRDHAGDVQVDALGVAAEEHAAATVCLNSTELFAGQLQPRRHDSHKGTFGDVMIVGGAHGMAGAPVLAARCALYAGAGRVMVASLDGGGGASYDSVHPEIMFRAAADQNLGRTTNEETLVIGPGLGGSAQAMGLLADALQGDATIVLDADGLNLVGASIDLAERLAGRAARGHATILTPHPLEAARLLGLSTPEVQQDRLATAQRLAERYQAVVVLKGSGSIIAAPGQVAVVNANGNPGLATGGSGDTLAGLCGALLAQGWPAREAACGAVWLHGAAADRLVAQGVGPIGLTAGELPVAVWAVLNELVAQAAENGRRQA
ncbi:MAG: bifunctional ADP-dependent NAD(P)H-hydrate dehydratase/NAD(P)H-hydrate epimerase [Massilia sp.]|nr:bifunctional ADP-dependent NAD(P)H-hydrate dehydratase/NAD(P)H-hydrate epimerase [Massilia sp.]